MQLANSGAKLVCWDISKRENTALVIELKSMGADATGYEVDVSEINHVQRVAAKVINNINNYLIQLLLCAECLYIYIFLNYDIPNFYFRSKKKLAMSQS